MTNPLLMQWEQLRLFGCNLLSWPAKLTQTSEWNSTWCTVHICWLRWQWGPRAYGSAVGINDSSWKPCNPKVAFVCFKYVETERTIRKLGTTATTVHRPVASKPRMKFNLHLGEQISAEKNSMTPQRRKKNHEESLNNKNARSKKYC